MNDIVRMDSNERLSRIVIHGDTVYVAGVTSTAQGDIAAQTRDVLDKIDGYLARANTDKSRLLSVQIWLKDIERDFAGMNEVWAQWAPPRAMPTRATCEARLAGPEMLVEIIVTAAARPGYVSGPVSES
ncbi:RidA family protein [Achromobacter sp. NFACC18-2]|uniref:RidA family protein n=1 Tax=Achromobacter sp. NFACC18-2 TaxID=1564112 RepID=UPI0008C4960C|nr:RidA family protein [Achromobacter sp. NFACC18-2]SEI68299.1 Enamine deaminase RidA, house cleaning of reactive enamine intermediates, YjgF/YER057c/UK114 family [Achromobacter sp. NFACC18-2]